MRALWVLGSHCTQAPLDHTLKQISVMLWSWHLQPYKLMCGHILDSDVNLERRKTMQVLLWVRFASNCRSIKVLQQYDKLFESTTQMSESTLLQYLSISVIYNIILHSPEFQYFSELIFLWCNESGFLNFLASWQTRFFSSGFWLCEGHVCLCLSPTGVLNEPYLPGPRKLSCTATFIWLVELTDPICWHHLESEPKQRKLSMQPRLHASWDDKPFRRRCWCSVSQTVLTSQNESYQSHYIYDI